MPGPLAPDVPTPGAPTQAPVAAGPSVDGRWKGLPPSLPPTPIERLGAMGWSLLGDDLPSVVAVLREEALDWNRAWMARLLRATDALLAPHGKTTMSPELFRMQLADGAWGLTVATVHQAEVALAAGARRVLLANPVIAGPELAWLAAVARRPEVELFTLVDGAVAVERLAALGAPLRVLLEVGYPGGRTGCRSVEEALTVARAVRAVPTLRLAGIEAYEGLIPAPSVEARAARVRDFLDTVVDAAVACRAAGLLEPEPLLSAGGSAFPDLVARRFGAAQGFRTLLRSGCYLTGDHGLYAAALGAMATRDPALAGEGLRPALEVWATVLSRPEPGRAIVAAGKRDLGIDAGLPVVLGAASPRVGLRPLEAVPVEVNDQHLHLALAPSAPLAVGDRVALGVTHPCTTFDRWSVLLRVDAAGRVVGAVHTRFG